MARTSPLLDTLRRWALWLVVVVIVVAVLGSVYLAYRVTSDRAESFSEPIEQFNDLAVASKNGGERRWDIAGCAVRAGVHRHEGSCSNPFGHASSPEFATMPL